MSIHEDRGKGYASKTDTYIDMHRGMSKACDDPGLGTGWGMGAERRTRAASAPRPRGDAAAKLSSAEDEAPSLEH